MLAFFGYMDYMILYKVGWRWLWRFLKAVPHFGKFGGEWVGRTLGIVV